jgi:urea transport system substrate-binding protein
VVDPASNWDLFAEKAKQLLLQDKVAGGPSAAGRR